MPGSANANTSSAAALTHQLQSVLHTLQTGASKHQSDCLVKVAQAIVDWESQQANDKAPRAASYGDNDLRGAPTVNAEHRSLAKVLSQTLSPMLETLSRDPAIAKQMDELFTAAQNAKAPLANLSGQEKTDALCAMAEAIRANETEILAANKKDLAVAAAQGATPSVMDRLTLDSSRLNAMADSLVEIAGQDDPVNRVMQSWDNPKNGLNFEKVSVPLGVIGMIYEARPNVTTDAAAICLKSGNPVILRPGSNCHATSMALADALQKGAAESGVPEGAIQIVPTKDREAVGEMLKARGKVDLIIPRGGASLTRRVFEEARVPTLLHLDGNCHTFVDKNADAKTALAVVTNAKMRRTGICGATESLVVHKDRAEDLLPDLAAALYSNGCEMVGDDRACALLPGVIKPAHAEDFKTEFLGPKLSVQIVDSLDEAIDTINQNSSKHTESIITQDESAQDKFLLKVKSAITMVNTSTQFADGGEFGFGAEIGISTGQTPPRGPVGADQLVSFKYNVRSEGAVRSGGKDVVDLPQARALMAQAKTE